MKHLCDTVEVQYDNSAAVFTLTYFKAASPDFCQVARNIWFPLFIAGADASLAILLHRASQHAFGALNSRTQTSNSQIS